MKLMSFEIGLPTKERGVVSVVIHKKLSVMRKAIARLGHQNPEQCIATCFDCDRCSKNPFVAQIHLCAERIDPFVIVHESSHAAIHAVRMGKTQSIDDWEEDIAYSVSFIAAEIIAFCNDNNIDLFSRKMKDEQEAEDFIMEQLAKVQNPVTAAFN